jgi:hypothetical protein
MKTLFLTHFRTEQAIPFYQRFFLAVIAGHLITTGGEFQNMSELVKLPGYPMAIITSVVIALITIEHVYYSMTGLNQKYPTYDTDYKKIRWQLIACVLTPFLTVFILATIYYAFHGLFILDTMWPADHGWRVLLMLLVLNMIFGISMVKTTTVLNTDISPEATIFSKRKITHIIHDNGYNKICYNDGTEQLDNRSLYDLYQILESGAYILNPKKSIIKRDNIKFAGENLEGYYVVELFSPKGMRIPVSDRQKKFYTDFEGYL